MAASVRKLIPPEFIVSRAPYPAFGREAAGEGLIRLPPEE